MANADAAFGFVPVRHMSGNAPRANQYTITSGLAENIFTGDLCILTADGVVTPHTATETNNIGVFAGCSYTASDGSYVYSEYWPSGTVATDIIAYVYDDPYTVFKVQSAGSPAQTNIGNCADVVAGAGSTTTGHHAVRPYAVRGHRSNEYAMQGHTRFPTETMQQADKSRSRVLLHTRKEIRGLINNNQSDHPKNVL